MPLAGTQIVVAIDVGDRDRGAGDEGEGDEGGKSKEQVSIERATKGQKEGHPSREAAKS